MTGTDDELRRLIATIKSDRWLAHNFLFKKRRPVLSPEFHHDMVNLFAGPEQRVVMMSFRGSAKSTNGEEEIVLGSELMEFRNCLIIGSSFERSCDRLRAIKNEIANNEQLEKTFGLQQGDTWAESKIVMKNGTVCQAYGRDQSLRGVKHLDVRPDFCWVDDLEDEETARNPDSINRIMKWFTGVLMPALQPGARIRITGTPLHPKSVICQLAEDSEWISRMWPIKYLGDTGWASSWPGMFPLDEIDKIEKRHRRMGQMTTFNQEYMCKSEDEDQKPFKPNMVKVEAIARRWQGVYGMYDPARTTNTATSAQTGRAIWSWVGTKLLVWEADGHFWKPDEIVNDVVETNRIFKPIRIGIERDGLEEFIEQPLRQAMLKTGEVIPFEGIKAPQGKIDFIKGLQPFFKADEIIMTKRLPELEAQMGSFPSGLMDILNSLAYAPRLRPGLPIYEDFTARNVFEDLLPWPARGYWLCLNALDGIASGILCQLEAGSLRVFNDWMLEGDTPKNLRNIMEAAALESDGKLKVLAAPKTLEPYSTTGMKMAALQKNIQLRTGSDPLRGREQIRTMLRSMRSSMPEVAVHPDASWTLRGLSGGYVIEDGLAQRGPYKIHLEALESFVGLLRAGFMQEEKDDRYYATASTGARYLSSMRPGRA